MANKPKKAKAPKDPNAAPETKEAKFSRLASARVTTAVGKINLLGNLGGSGYSYTPEQVNKLETVLNEAVENVLTRLRVKFQVKEASKETIQI